MFKDIGLEWGINKCASTHIKRGVFCQSENIPLSSGQEIPSLDEEDHYKFLGKFENTTQLDKQILASAGREYERRLSLIWTSPLSIPRKVKATNTFATPVLQYHMWSSDWTMEDLQRLDRTTRLIIAENKGKHHLESNPLLYLPTVVGGRGLQEIEMLYKITKIKTAHYLNTSDDPHIKMIRTFQDIKERKHCKSIMKDAISYAQQLNIGITFDADQNKTVLNTEGGDIEVRGNSPRYIQQHLKKAMDTFYKDKVRSQLWVGNYMSQRWLDVNLSQDSYNLLSDWKNIPDVVHSVNTGIIQQLISKKLHQPGTDLSCSLCHSSDETIPHLLCSCPAIAQSIYKARHDKMLRPVYHYLLQVYGMTNDYSNPWYKQSIPVACEENDNAKILWDVPIWIDKPPADGANRPDMVVYDKKMKKIIIIEGTVCNVGQINQRNNYKTQKYTEIRQGLKKLYPDHNITQINFVFSFLGDYNTELVNTVNNIFYKKDGDKLARKCQKWLISQNCEVIKKLFM